MSIFFIYLIGSENHIPFIELCLIPFIKIYDNLFAALLLLRSWQLQIPLKVMASKAHKRLFLCCFICLICSYYYLSSVWGWRNLDPRNGLEKLAWALCQLQIFFFFWMFWIIRVKIEQKNGLTCHWTSLDFASYCWRKELC